MKICIDAGHNHSGYDTGATGNGLREQDITFEVADRLKDRLQAAGISVVMTREINTQNLGTSVNSSINKRVSIANANQVDYFISVHCNAGGGTGTETLVYKRGGQAEQLANRIQTAVVEALALKNRGVKEANLGVLRDTACPAVLVELGFIDHPSDAVLLAGKKELFADAIATGVFDYLGILPPDGNIGTIKKFLTEKWKLSEPEAVFSLLDTHPYREELYRKIYESY